MGPKFYTNVSGLENQIEIDLKRGLENLRIFEKIYLNLTSDALEYLKKYSSLYRLKISEIQKLILPEVKRICSKCEEHCCKLFSVRHNIYLARVPGGFSFKEFLLARYNNPRFKLRVENPGENLCPFWKNGCQIPEDSRSLLCISWFCEDLKKGLNMDKIALLVEEAEVLVKEFSLKKCLGFK